MSSLMMSFAWAHLFSEARNRGCRQQATEKKFQRKKKTTSWKKLKLNPKLKTQYFHEKTWNFMTKLNKF